MGRRTSSTRSSSRSAATPGSRTSPATTRSRWTGKRSRCAGRSIPAIRPGRLSTINQSLAHIHRTFEIKRGDAIVATLQEALVNILGDRFTITLASGDQLSVQGDWIDREFHVTQAGADVIFASRSLLSLHDTYGAQIADGLRRRAGHRDRRGARADGARGPPPLTREGGPGDRFGSAARTRVQPFGCIVVSRASIRSRRARTSDSFLSESSASAAACSSVARSRTADWLLASRMSGAA